jgi:ATP-dependent RNA helicase RhlE
VLGATDIAARGIDVEALSHVINFDVPAAPDDYIHRVGRTGRAEMTGEAFTFVSPDEESDLRAIERAIGRSLPRVTLPDFDYKARAAQLEVPLKDRIAAIRQRKRDDRERATVSAALRAARARGSTPQHPGPSAEPARATRRHSASGQGGASSGRFRPRRPRRRPM